MNNLHGILIIARTACKSFNVFKKHRWALAIVNYVQKQNTNSMPCTGKSIQSRWIISAHLFLWTSKFLTYKMNGNKSNLCPFETLNISIDQREKKKELKCFQSKSYKINFNCHLMPSVLVTFVFVRNDQQPLKWVLYLKKKKKLSK